jgi:hypothetical protein
MANQYHIFSFGFLYLATCISKSGCHEIAENAYDCMNQTFGKRLKNEKFTTADNEVMRLAHIALWAR